MHLPFRKGDILRRVALRTLARALFEGALMDCSIEQALGQRMMVADGANVVRFDNVSIDLAQMKHVRVIAVGKAGSAMLKALLARLPIPEQCDFAGVLIAPAPLEQMPPGFTYFPGGHPFPNEASFAGARAALSILQELPPTTTGTSESLCLFLISGGASAMMELPLDPGISLEDAVAFHRALVFSGASIAEINCVRKHFSAVKGGRLALAARGAECFSLLVSDVPRKHLSAIGSGPTLPDTSTVDECREILVRYKLMDRFPEAVQGFFASPGLPDTPKPADLGAQMMTLLDADDLAEAARRRAEELGFYAVVDNSCDEWDYSVASEYLLGRLRTLRLEHPRVCLISAGEVTVHLPNHDMPDSEDDAASVGGTGGRNQHFALHTATLLEDSDAPLAVLSAGSDGIDGNSEAAGAVIDEKTLNGVSDGRDLKAEAEVALVQFHSSALLEERGATILIGPTGNNLRDLRILLAEQSSQIEPEISNYQIQSAG
jgi:glycerate 2-kinase